tara:strand:+ start:398 stop:538 length:141 start_codon:yes stop_codon:yes gene_type:complete
MSNLIIGGIIVELGIAVGGLYLIKKIKKRDKNQPALSNKIIKNLKF